MVIPESLLWKERKKIHTFFEEICIKFLHVFRFKFYFFLNSKSRGLSYPLLDRVINLGEAIVRRARGSIWVLTPLSKVVVFVQYLGKSLIKLCKYLDYMNFNHNILQCFDAVYIKKCFLFSQTWTSFFTSSESLIILLPIFKSYPFSSPVVFWKLLNEFKRSKMIF